LPLTTLPLLLSVIFTFLVAFFLKVFLGALRVVAFLVTAGVVVVVVVEVVFGARYNVTSSIAQLFYGCLLIFS